MHWPSLQVNSPSEQVVSLIGFTFIAIFVAVKLGFVGVELGWNFLAVELGVNFVDLAFENHP